MAFRVQLKGLFLWCLMSILCSTSVAQSQIEISQGILQGITLRSYRGRDISAYLAIPYAEPPVGPLRFAKPVPAGKWDGILNATRDANSCLQSSSNQFIGAEDCLYLNVYVPQLANDNISSLLPVMVYVHGGGYKEGSGSSLTYGPQYILDKDVVLVTINYRLGVFGFLSSGDEVAPGNWGLKDQVLALKWVQDNIENFGGDPDHVTIFGESAGGASVHFLSLSPSTEELFHKFIAQSGSAVAPRSCRSLHESGIQGFQFGEYAGCSSDTSDALISCLRTGNLSMILDAYVNYTSGEWIPTIESGIDDAFIVDSPAHLYANGQIRDLPWLTGVVRDEAIVLLGGAYGNEEIARSTIENINSVLASHVGVSYDTETGKAVVDAIKSYYFNDDFSGSLRVLIDRLSLFISGIDFFYPALNGIRQHVAVVNSPQYFYAFEYRGAFSFSLSFTGSPENFGVAHADDLIYLFPTFPLGTESETSMNSDEEMMQSMVELWTSFAINGIPTASALNGSSWNAYSAEEDNYLRIGNNSDPSLKMEHSWHVQEMEFLADIIRRASESDNSVAGTSPSLLFILAIGCFQFISTGFNFS
ncbi:esterase E4-like [Athalia rosae]|uniref:esterase E4-like n=1 Tax=Athalia rosae TaxID=37344 RepID=UPI00203498DF|nr:esterase E4-like [Athalia rosae]